MNSHYYLAFFLFVLSSGTLHAAQYEGTYILQDSSCQGSLVLHAANSEKHSVSIKTLCGTKGQGCRFQGVSALSQQHLLFNKNTNCQLKLEFQEGKVRVQQKGLCQCGYNASMAGTYENQ